MSSRHAMYPADTARAVEFALTTRPRGSSIHAATQRGSADRRTTPTVTRPDRVVARAGSPAPARRWGTTSVNHELAARVSAARQNPAGPPLRLVANGDVVERKAVARPGARASTGQPASSATARRAEARELHPAGSGQRAAQGAGLRSSQGAGPRNSQGADPRVAPGAGLRSSQGEVSRVSQGAGPRSSQGAGPGVAPGAGSRGSGSAGPRVAGSAGPFSMQGAGPRHAGSSAPTGPARRASTSASQPGNAPASGPRTLGTAALADPAPLRAPNSRPTRSPKAENRPNLRVAPPPRPVRSRRYRRVRRTLWIVGVAGFLVAAAWSSLFLRASINGRQLVLERVRTQLSDEEHRNTTLRREVAVLESPGSVIAAANELGLTTANTVTFLRQTTPSVTEVHSTAAETSSANSAGDAKAGQDAHVNGSAE